MNPPSATRQEIRELLEDVDDAIIDRVLRIGATVQEIAEAIDEVEGRNVAKPRAPSSPRVLAVQRILEEAAAQ